MMSMIPDIATRARSVPTPVYVAAPGVLAFAVLAARFPWWGAFAAVTLAYVIAYVVYVVPRNTVLPVTNLEPEEILAVAIERHRRGPLPIEHEHDLREAGIFVEDAATSDDSLTPHRPL